VVQRALTIVLVRRGVRAILLVVAVSSAALLLVHLAPGDAFSTFDADPAYAAGDFRMRAFRDALASVSQGDGRLERIQLLLSDPTTEPLGALDRKSAFGAYDQGQSRAG